MVVVLRHERAADQARLVAAAAVAAAAGVQRQQAHVRGLEDKPKDLWEALKKRHVQERPTARFNAFDDFFSIRLEEGEEGEKQHDVETGTPQQSLYGPRRARRCREWKSDLTECIGGGRPGDEGTAVVAVAVVGKTK